MERSPKETGRHVDRALGPGTKMRDFVAAYFDGIGRPAGDLEFHAIPSDGSMRVFWRVTSRSPRTSLVAMENAPTTDFLRRENLAYLKIGGHLFQKGLPVPEIFRSDLVNGLFIMEDMGEASLQVWTRQTGKRIPIYKKVIDTLFRLQTEGSRGFDTAWTCQTRTYDRAVMRRYEAHYFRDAFLFGYLGLERDWAELEGPFGYLSETASKADNRFFLHRDFQSRNIMVCGDKIGILDWQGGRLGPLAYDLASLLIDPYTGLSPAEKERLFDHYLRLVGDYQPEWVPPFEKYFPYLAIQRNLQILGAFAFLTRVKGKPFFEDYIHPALNSLYDLLEKLGDQKLSALKDLSESLLNSKAFG